MSQVLFFKATTTKTITVPSYTKRDGTIVSAFTKLVHYDPDKEVKDIVTGKGSHSQKLAHKKLMQKPGFSELPVEHQFAHILSAATDIQKEASNSAALSLWTSSIGEDKLPTNAQQFVYEDLPFDKKMEQIGKAQKKGASNITVAKLKAAAILQNAYEGHEIPEAVSKWLQNVLLGMQPPDSQKNAMASYMLQHGTSGAKIINTLEAHVGGHRKLMALLDSNKPAADENTKPIDPHTIPGIEGWHASLAAGKVPTVEQHQAVTDYGFDAIYEKVKQVNPPHTIANINSLIDQAANQWLAASNPTKDKPPRGESAPSLWKLETFKHTTKGHDVFVVPVPYHMMNEEYAAHAAIAKKHGGHYSKFAKDGAKKGFLFPTTAQGYDFIHEVEKGVTFIVKLGTPIGEPSGALGSISNPIKLPDFPNTKFVFNPASSVEPFGKWEMHEDDGIFDASEIMSVALELILGHRPKFSFVESLSDSAKAAAVKTAAAYTGKATIEIQTLLSDVPKEGDTKIEDGKTYMLYDGRWHLQDSPALDVSFWKQPAEKIFEEHAKDPAVLGFDINELQAEWLKHNPGKEAEAENAYQKVFFNEPESKLGVDVFKTGSHYQKEAYKKLSASAGWSDVPLGQQLVALKELYSQLQGAASHAAAVSLWKKSALAGKNPTMAQWKAYMQLDEAKQKELFMLVEKKHGSTAHLKPLLSHDAPPELVQKKGVIEDIVYSDGTGVKYKKNKQSGNWSYQKKGISTWMPVMNDVWVSSLDEGKTPLGNTLLVDVTPNIAQSVSEPVWDFTASDPGFSGAPSLLTQGDIGETFYVVYGEEGGKPFYEIGKLNDQGVHVSDPEFYPDAQSAQMAVQLLGSPNLALEQVNKLSWVSSTPQSVAATQLVYHNTTEGHNKFWAIHLVDNKMTTTYGKIGTKGTSTTKEFASHQAAQDAAFKIKNDKLSTGYKLVETKTVQVVSVPSGNFTMSPVGPKEGDTKQGADGQLIFKDGRWHKVEKPFTPAQKKSAALSAAINAVQIPDFLALDSHTNAKSYPPLAASIKAAVKLNGLAGFKTYITVGTDGSFKSKGATAGFKTNKCYPDKGSPRQKAFGKFCAELYAVLLAHKGIKPLHVEGAPSPAAHFSQPAPSVSAAAKPIKLPGIKVGQITAPDIKGWEQTGPQKGSNPGGQFKDKNGQQWYCKFPADANVVKNEFIAAKFYQMLGVAVPNLKLVSKDGKLGIASKWVEGLTVVDAAKLAKAKGTHEGFAIDAWLANWDVVGLSNDNLLLDKDGRSVHVDVGGSLLYRAQGGAKGDAFGDTVTELDSLLDKKLNPKTAAVYGKVTEESMDFGLQQLNRLKPSQIEELCEKIGPGTAKEQEALAKTLIARRTYILQKFGIRDQWNEKPVDETKLSVNPVDLPKPIDFVNYHEVGKGLSSSPHVNENNTKDSAAMIAFALKGNLTALKEYKYDVVDKETGASLGKMPITDHPAKLIKEQWAGLVELLQSIAHPPKETLPLPSIGSAGSVEEISEMVGSFLPGERVETVAAEHRMGFFMKLGQIDDVSELLEGYKWSFLTKQSGWVKESYNKFNKLSSAMRAYIGAVQSTGWINHIFSQGKSNVSASGNGGSFSGGVQTLAEKVYKDAVEIPEGTVLYRGMSDTTAGKSMTQQFINAKPGLIVQNTDSMCSSYNEHHSWGGDVQLKIRCPKGAKGIPSFASGNYGSEHEITTLPGQRFVVLSVDKKSSGHGVVVDVLMLPPHDGFVTELGKLAALGKAMVLMFRKVG